MSSLDEQLQALEQQYRQPPATDALDQHLADLAQQYQQRRRSPTQSPAPDAIAGMLASLEQDAITNQLRETAKNHEICNAITDLIETKHQQRAVVAQKTSTENIEAIAAAEKRKQEQTKYWHDKAHRWLKELDPLSNEGMWFTEFAEKYESPFAAALDYLMALE